MEPVVLTGLKGFVPVTPAPPMPGAPLRRATASLFRRPVQTFRIGLQCPRPATPKGLHGPATELATCGLGSCASPGILDSARRPQPPGHRQPSSLLHGFLLLIRDEIARRRRRVRHRLRRGRPPRPSSWVRPPALDQPRPGPADQRPGIHRRRAGADRRPPAAPGEKPSRAGTRTCALRRGALTIIFSCCWQLLAKPERRPRGPRHL